MGIYINLDRFTPANIKVKNGEVVCKVPSNIALIKYWGKRLNQFPENPSLSMTLSESYTETKLTWALRENIERITKFDASFLEYSFLSDLNLSAKFKERVVKYVENIDKLMPFLRYFKINIESKNSFPHSAGIASSASSMGSMALALMLMEKEIFLDGIVDDDFFEKTSYFARLGSGSAARSLFGGFVSWGKHQHSAKSSDEYATKIFRTHPNFKTLCDAVLIVDSSTKEISSRDGHRSMVGHNYSDQKFKSARENFSEMYGILKSGDVERWGQIVENEALSLHAMMMTAIPAYFLMRPNTLKIIEEIKSFRSTQKIPVYFSLDAGPNIHMLYFSENKKIVHQFIESTIKKYLENGLWIDDCMGKGPEFRITSEKKMYE